MESNKIIIFLKNLWRDSIMPLVRSQNEQRDKSVERILKAIQDKEIDVAVNLDTEEISHALTSAIKNIDTKIVVKNDMGQLLSLFKSNKDKGDVIRELRKIGENIPKNTDYSDILGKIEQKIEKTDNSNIEKLLKQLATAEDISVLASWLAVVAEKEYPEFPDFPRDKNGIPLFTPTKLGGGGGGGLTQIESQALQSLEEKQGAFADYYLTKFDITSSPIYMGSVNATGKCVIKRIDISGGVYEYFIADTDFDTHWTDRTSLTYVPYNQLTF